MGISCLYHSRFSAGFRYSTLLLGFYHRRSVCSRQARNVFILASRSCNYNPDRSSSLVDRHCPLHIPSNILPSNPRKDPRLLQDSPSPSYHRLVLRHGRHSELFHVCAIWTILGIPMELAIYTTLGNCTHGSYFLHRGLDRHSSHFRQTLQITLLDPTYLRHWSRCTTLGSDALGNIWLRTMASMDANWWCNWRSTRGSCTLALARSA